MSGKTQELTLAQVESSKIYVGNGMINFQHPMSYVGPFIDILEPLGVELSFVAEKGSHNKDSEDDSVGNIAYSRLITKAKLPSEFDILINDPLFKHSFAEIGFVYALDSAKPEMKVYRGNRVSVCTNMCIFGASNILQMVITDPKSSVNNVYEKTQRYVEDSYKEVERIKSIYDQLTSEIYGEQMINQKFGELMRLGIANTKLGTNPVVGAIQAMLDSKSKYSIGEDKKISAWKMYNSLTEMTKKSSILDEASRTLILEKMFLHNN